MLCTEDQYCYIPVPCTVSEMLKQDVHSGERALALLAVKFVLLLRLPDNGSRSIPSFVCSRILVNKAGSSHCERLTRKTVDCGSCREEVHCIEQRAVSHLAFESADCAAHC